SLVVCGILLALATVPAVAGTVVRFRMADTVQPASQKYVERALAIAASSNADLVVMELDTPGGLVSSARAITTAITSSRVPVVVYVAPSGAQAASAGFFILMAADVAAMAPGTNTGAAHPVGGKGENLPGDVRKKATNDAAAMVRALVEPRHRDPKLAEKAVTESLSFSASEALKNGLIDLIAPSLDDLLKQLDGREIERFDGSRTTLKLEPVRIEELEPTAAERFLSVLANPNVAYLLMALGMLGIYVELTHPGGVLPGVVGVISMLLALYSLSVLPVNLAGVALIVVGLILFVLEVKITSYGLLTVGGLAAFVLGSLMLFNSPIPAMRVSLALILPTAVVVAFLTIFLLSRVIAAHKRRPVTGKEGMLGERGEVRLRCDPVGKVLVHGEYWDAITEDGTTAETGSVVEVVAVEDRRLRVRAVEEGARSS
ncbi:MAG TPA: nodulation protein NfeD, partial [Acidobacteria bacterium]|nr:nodulation protein NfeD [Acidobacteriota bacterium]